MSDYVRVYNLTVKDSLPTGDSGKVIKGTELDVELNAVAAAISSKSDINSPTFTGTPAAPTAAFGTNDTQLATTAFVQAALQAIYPIGSIYTNAGVSTNPATLLGFGTWAAFGEGKVLVGLNAADTDFDTLEETGGSKAGITAHTHTVTVSGTTSSAGVHNHSVADPGHAHGTTIAGFYGAGPFQPAGGSSGVTTAATSTATTGIGIVDNGAHTHTISSSGTTSSTGTSNGNLQPYVVVKMWKRTA